MNRVEKAPPGTHCFVWDEPRHCRELARVEVRDGVVPTRICHKHSEEIMFGLARELGYEVTKKEHLPS